MKKQGLMAIALALTIGMSFSSYAGQWKSNSIGWWWQNDDGSYPQNGWQWIDSNQDGMAESYYFDQSGYLLTNTLTPDGYTVNQDGAWTVGGVVQLKNNSQNSNQFNPETSSIDLKSGWNQKNGKWVYVESDGTLAINEWRKAATGEWCYIDENGYMVENSWKQIDGKQYYFGEDGHMLSDIATPDDNQEKVDGMQTEEMPLQVQTIINVEGLSPQQNGYVVTYQYFNVFEDSFGDAEYQAIIEIQNTSSGNLYLGTATFDIYDRAGNIVASETLISSDPSVIAPGEKGYYYSNGGYLDNVPMGDYVLRPTINVEPTNLSATRFSVSGTSIKTTSFGKNIDVLGTIRNNTAKDEAVLWVVIVLFDNNNLPIGIYGTNILDVNAGSTVGFEAEGWHLPEYITIDDVAKYEVIAAPIQYQF